MEKLIAEGWMTIPNNPSKTLDIIAAEFGNPIASSSNGKLVDILKLRQKGDAPSNSLSARYGCGSFPFHTDCAHHKIPPRFVLMRLQQMPPTDQVIRPTKLLDLSKQILSPKEVARLRRDVWMVNTGLNHFPTTIMNGKFLRYDEACMVPMLPSYHASEFTFKRIQHFPICDVVNWNNSFVLVIDNWRLLHARSGSIAHESSERTLERSQTDNSKGIE